MFSIYFTKAQAEQYIKERLCSNFINVPEFTVIISDVESTKEATEESSENTLEVNPWLIPDEDGWFTHDPEWKSEECPPYIAKNKKIIAVVQEEIGCIIYEYYEDYANRWDWSTDVGGMSIVRWKYVD